MVRSRLVLLCVVGLGLLSACATPSSSSPSSSSSSPVGDACPRALALTEADAQTQVCVAIGGTVTVSLSSTPGQEWKPLQLNGTGLTVIPPPSRPSNATVASYHAAGAGTAELTSSRAACPPPAPGAVACHALQAFTVTVTVR